jgi:hypothetical protein
LAAALPVALAAALRRWSCTAVLAVAAIAAQPVLAQSTPSTDPNDTAISKFTGARWSLISPDKDFEGGCVVGFLAWEFSPTGYFTYNNRIRGSWRIDELGNLKLRTRDGVRLTLLVEGTTLRPSRNFAFLRRAELYQKCTE